ncbi:uncharacterized protein B0I36DRAFT_425111 [Microdochium trichocladiopsis]|uniref:Uncharacterized protein n=1 Tax=Microdochium trichocladiopsis TaxID=1682393 RepID=A0A9P8XWG9_9PEZI|nr:uncharacterized protein B0I36DRAFT_425111 [Microdochium trichocladiopsis]KAH7021455.1 hypothetical protein B0I36DRAFT_425111 [Microdochium trichocladiopsis]
MTVDLGLPADLHERAVRQFDALHAEGRLLYSETKPEIVTHNGFTFEFRICPILNGKQILSKDAPERSGKGGPFINPDPTFVVTHIGNTHTLLLNLRCIYRPMYVLHTRLFAPQTDDLDVTDVSAAWDIMGNLAKSAGPQMMIYNCGVDAGSSQGHKHVQIFECSSSIELLPSRAESTTEIATDIPSVPYEHFVLRLPASATAAQVHSSLQRLVDTARERRGPHGQWSDYNVVLTADWVCVIPRRHAVMGTTGANGAGIVGLCWVRDQAERDSWDELGLTRHLAYLAVEKKVL